jgi:hypothetical protein
MKIQINELESYEIAIPDKDITSQRFFEILSRLNAIGKILGKSAGDTILSQPTPRMPKSATKTHKGNGLVKILRNDRALFVQAIRNYYELKDQAFVGWFKEKTGFKLTAKNALFNKSTRQLKIDFKITPQEVGLVKFPVRGEGRRLKFLDSGEK